ncbi:DnaA N-terminal domain-containing protein [Candidatus Tisiphia endosymbiont of Myopa tessellatipennis]|uniref:DnaA N-terminal domain-containing protein n=1 Tax=Candidatus Tisiphia endosymbiont of Myopa tessellatipennis TaxID=3066257 RepID=UPI00313B2CD9
MTESLIFSDNLIENPDAIFYNIVGNFVPPEWRNLTNNCGKQLSKTSRQLLSLIVSCIKTGNYRNSDELQEGYHFFQQELGVCQRRVRQCLVELKDSGFIDIYSTTIVKHNVKCPNILCVKLVKKFINLRKNNCDPNQQKISGQPEINYSLWQNIQPNPQKISIQPEKNYHPTVKNFQKNASIYISIISRYGNNKENCGQVCGQNVSEPESTEEQNINFLLEVTAKRGEQSLSEVESTTEQNFDSSPEITVSSSEKSLPKLESTEEKSFNLPMETTVSSVNETLPCNSSEAAPTDDESDCDSDSDSTGESSGNSEEQEASGKLPRWLSDITKQAKGWYSHRKLEMFYPLSGEDADWLKRQTGRNYELSFVNKLLIKHSVDSPNRLFPCKQAVLNYMKKTLIHEMRPPAKANNPNFNFDLNNATKTKTKKAYLQKIRDSKGVKPLNQLQRKIVEAFEHQPSTAYQLLKRCSFFGVYDDEYKIDLADISLSETDKLKLLEQVQEVYGKDVQQLRITNKREVSDYDLELSGLNPESVWYKVRKYLLKLYGEHLDKAWFSKLEAIEEDTTCNKLILKPATAFIGDWIKNKYSKDLEYACSKLNYTFEFMKVDRMAGL